MLFVCVCICVYAYVRTAVSTSPYHLLSAARLFENNIVSTVSFGGNPIISSNFEFWETSRAARVFHTDKLRAKLALRSRSTQGPLARPKITRDSNFFFEHVHPFFPSVGGHRARNETLELIEAVGTPQNNEHSCGQFNPECGQPAYRLLRFSATHSLLGSGPDGRICPLTG